MSARLQRIVDACGGVVLAGGRRALIRGPQHGPADRSVSLVETEDGRILIHCFSPRDDWRAVRDLLIEQGLLDEAIACSSQPRPVRPPSVAPGDEERVARARRFWDEAQSIAGAVAERYLRGRAIIGQLPGAEVLRFHAHMTSLEDKARRPALVCAIVSAEGAFQGIQATLLSAHGVRKAALATPRRTIGRLLGGAVRLDGPGEALIVAEGLETALSARAALGVGTWALLSAENLAQFTPPPTLKRLVIAADNDAAGEAAAKRLHERLGRSLDCALAFAPGGFNDWNDWARSQRF